MVRTELGVVRIELGVVIVELDMVIIEVGVRMVREDGIIPLMTMAATAASTIQLFRILTMFFNAC